MDKILKGLGGYDEQVLYIGKFGTYISDVNKRTSMERRERLVALRDQVEEEKNVKYIG